MADAGENDSGGLPARRLAWEILQRVEDGAFADVLLGHRLGKADFAARDQGLATRLVYGTLAWQGYLDHLLAPFCRRPLVDLDAPVLTLLRMAMLQIAVLTKIPKFAAVNTSVELAKKHRQGHAAGFVNAVLRKAATEWTKVALPDAITEPTKYLSERWSHPQWLVQQWIDLYGRSDTEALLQADNETAPTTLRINRLRADIETVSEQLRAAGFACERSRYAPLALRLESPAHVERIPGYREGHFSFQGEASQLVTHLLAPQPGERILDLCAAPGGKSLHIAELMDARGEVMARDINVRGVAHIRSQATRLGLANLRAEVGDAVAWAGGQGNGEFDRVLVDAPCSGLGTLRSHPELRWRRKPRECKELAALQLAILENAAGQVRAGGVITYATCTLSSVENDAVVEQLLARHPELAIDDPSADLPVAARALLDQGKALRTFPHRDGLDGFFAIRLKRS